MKKVCAPLLGAFIVCCFFTVCSTEEAIEQVLGSGSSQPPVFLACKAVSAGEVAFQFSLPVKVVSVSFDPSIRVASVEDGSVITVSLADIPGAGEKVTADLLVEDQRGNTLNVLVPFRTRNDRLPPLLITELRTEYSKPKAEFVEFKTLAAGNLGALRLFITGNTKSPLVFDFPPVEVAAGEYILIHLRTTEEGTADEAGSDLNLSGGTDSVQGARDFWVPGSVKLLRKTDTVYFLDQDDRVIDAVMMSENPDPWWAKEHFAAAAEMLKEKGAWAAPDSGVPGPQDAVITAAINTAMTKSISRNEAAADTNTAADWFITAKDGISPGRKNSVK
jgi:hypothetical protein